jgi:hypothetical protein
MVLNFREFSDNPLLLFLSAVIFALALWVILEALYAYRKERKGVDIVQQEPSVD